MISDSALLPTTDEQCRFSSLASLKAANNELLKRRRNEENTAGFLNDVKGFIEKVQVTGTILNVEDERWTSQSLLDYWLNFLCRADIQTLNSELTLAPFDPALAPELDESKRPYLGLDAFRETTHSLFFGRQKLIEELCLKLKGQRFLAVIGPSGSGKSSLVRAGLLPALKDGSVQRSQKWHYYPPLVPGSEPLTSLALLVQPPGLDDAQWVQQQIDGFKQNTGHLLQLINQANSETVLVVIDQFEEIFTLANDETVRRAFIDNLLQLVEYPDLRHTVIITMRSDFETYVAKIPALQSYFTNSARVTPLTAAELREAIEQPAQLVGLKFEEGIVNELVNEVLGEPAGLPLLQFTLRKLWDDRRQNLVTWEAFHQLGGCREALTRTADKFYKNLSAIDQLRVKWILLRLVRPSEGLEVFSNRVPRDTLYKAGEQREHIDQVLDKLIKVGLVRETDSTAPGEVKVEVAHEALVRHWHTLVTWLEEERVIMRKRLRLREAADQWDVSGRDASQLLRGSLLDEALRYDDLSEREEVFVKKSLTHKRRKRSLIVLAASMTFILLSVLAAFSYYQARAARAAERKAFSRQLASQALNNRNRLDLALLLSMEAYRIDPTVEARNSLLTLLEEESLGLMTYLQTPTSPAISLSFSNSSNLTSLNDDGTINVWDPSKPQMPRRVVSLQINDAIMIGVPSQDGKVFAIGTDKGEVILVDSTTGQHLWRYEIPHSSSTRNYYAHSLALSDDGRILALVSFEDSNVTLLDVATGKKVRDLTVKGDDGIASIAFSKNGKILALGTSLGNHVVLMDVATGQQFYLQRKEDKDDWRISVLVLAFSPDGKTLASWDESGTIRLWDVSSRKFLFEITKGNTEHINALVFKDDETLASGGQNGAIVLWRLSLENEIVAPIKTFSAGSDEILSIVFSPDGKTLISSNRDQNVIIWNTETTKIWNTETTKRLTTELSLSDAPSESNYEHDLKSSRFYNAAFSPDGKVLASGSNNQTIILWDVASRQPLAGGPLVTSPDEDGNRSVPQKYPSESETRASELLRAMRDADRAKSLRTLDLAFSRDGKFLVARYSSGKAVIWNVADRMPVFQINVPGKTVTAVAISPDGKLVAWANEKTKQKDDEKTRQNNDLPAEAEEVTLTLQNIASDQSSRSLSEHGKDSVMSIAFSPDGKILASGTANSSITLWNVDTGAQVTQLSAGQTNRMNSMIRREVGIQSLAFSPDGKNLAAGNLDNTVIIWDVASRKPLGTAMKYSSSIKNVTFSPDGKILASASLGGVVLWDVATQQLLCKIDLGRNSFMPSHVAYSPDNQFIAIASGNKSLMLWDSRLTSWQETACRTANRNLTQEEWSKYLSASPDHDKYRATCPDLPIDEGVSINGQNPSQ